MASLLQQMRKKSGERPMRSSFSRIVLTAQYKNPRPSVLPHCMVQEKVDSQLPQGDGGWEKEQI
jgi:hypothetical protein